MSMGMKKAPIEVAKRRRNAFWLYSSLGLLAIALPPLGLPLLALAIVVRYLDARHRRQLAERERWLAASQHQQLAATADYLAKLALPTLFVSRQQLEHMHAYWDGDVMREAGSHRPIHVIDSAIR